ncbi:MAG: antitoxin [Corynebacteriales bacterium]|nr:antitoxin [Mycobacteriales bacterium]
MGNMMDKGKDMLSGKKDKAEEGMDKGGDMLDEKTGRKHSDKIDRAQEMAKEQYGKAAGDS